MAGGAACVTFQSSRQESRTAEYTVPFIPMRRQNSVLPRYCLRQWLNFKQATINYLV